MLAESRRDRGVLRKVIIGGELGAVLGTLAGILLSVSANTEEGPVLGLVRTALIAGGIWMSIGAVTGALVEVTRAEGITLEVLAGGFLRVIAWACNAGVILTMFGYVAQALLLERSNPWGMNNNDPNLAIFGTFIVASGSAVGAAAIGFLTWAVIVLVRHHRECSRSI